MKIFISWSGERSRIIAEGLNEWLPNVFQYIETFYSPNIEKGTKGGAQINDVLKDTSFGIICLTPENLQNNWIHYEAGALAKINDDNTRVWTLLIGLNHSNVVHPLAQFQHTLAQKEDIYKLLESINKHLEKPLLEHLLRKHFEKWWSELEDKIKEAEKVVNKEQKLNQSGKNIRDNREVLDEVLEILRNQQRLFSNLKFVGDSKSNERHSLPKTIKNISFVKEILFTLESPENESDILEVVETYPIQFEYERDFEKGNYWFTLKFSPIISSITAQEILETLETKGIPIIDYKILNTIKF